MLKNFLIRLLVYPFCVLIIVLGYKMSFGELHYSNSIYIQKARFFGVIGIGIALVYLISDIAYQIKKVLSKKKN